MTDEEVKMPWESKTLLISFIGIVLGLLGSFGIAGANLTTEQISAIATIVLVGIAIARKYGGGIVVLSEAAKVEKKAELDEACISKANDMKVQ